MIRIPFLSLISAVALTGATYAGDVEPMIETTPVANSDFESSLRLNGWIVQVESGLSNTALGLSKSVFLGFDDIISNIDWIAPIGADFRYKRLGFMPDLVALKISGAGSTPGPLYDRADVSMTMGVLNLMGYYRLVDQPNLKFDVMGGARYLWVDIDVAFSGGPLGSALGRAEAGTDADIWDGVVGLRLQQDLNDKLYYSIYGDIGTGNSDRTWQLQADLGYRLSENLSVSAGYRYLHYELGREHSEIELTSSGPQITVNWKF